MEEFWRETLAERFGSHNIINALEGTALEPYAQQACFGIFVIRGAVGPAQTRQFEDDMDDMFEDLSIAYGTNAVKLLQKRRKTSFYNSVQAKTGNECSCTYATARINLLIQMPDRWCKVLSDSEAWLHEGVDKRKFRFDDIVANMYDSKVQERVPWHSDDDAALGANTVILSITTHSARAFCFQPKWDSDLCYKFLSYKCSYRDRKHGYIDAGVRGVVPLKPGDIMVMTGTAQDNLEHRTLINREITVETMESYPAINANLQNAMDELLIDVRKGLPRYRGGLTFRKIIFHWPICGERRMGLCLANKWLRENAYRNAGTHIVIALCLARKWCNERSVLDAERGGGSDIREQCIRASH